MHVTRREFLGRTGLFGMAALALPASSKSSQTVNKPIRIKSCDVLKTIFTRSAVVEEQSYFQNCHPMVCGFDGIARYEDYKRLTRYIKHGNIFVPMMSITEYRQMNQEAIRLLSFSAQKSTSTVLNPTHEIVTKTGVLQLDLRHKGMFIHFVCPIINDYGLLVIDVNKVGKQNA